MGLILFPGNLLYEDLMRFGPVERNEYDPGARRW